MNALKQKLLNCENVCGTHINMSDIMVSDIFGSAGYDFVWIDTEHAPIDYNTLLTHLTVLGSKGVNSIVRLQMDNYNHTKRVLEMGPTGVVFPMINTAEEAKKAIASTYYPPKGNRGIGAQRAMEYGNISIQDVADREDDIIRCIQLETVKAIENLPEIVKVKGIDCFIFGMCDLSFDIGEINNVWGEKELSYLNRAIKILKDNGKSIGISTYCTEEDKLKKWTEMGINFISTGADFEYLRQSAKDTLIKVKRAQGK